jgi:predicted transglutaminase-like cysteine proteinase
MRCRVQWAMLAVVLLTSAGRLQAGETLKDTAYSGSAGIVASIPSAGTLQETTTSHSPFEGEFGPTLPPIGYVKFCATGQTECKTKGGNLTSIIMTQSLWKQLNLVNHDANTTIVPTSDQQLYGEAERWAYPKDKGDCEDFVLLKKRKLVQLGFAPGALLITVVRDEHGRGHAVLSVTTDGGDYVLDNRRDNILRWSETHYTFLERQSHSDPMQWVALQKQDTHPVEIVFVRLSAVASGRTHH